MNTPSGAKGETTGTSSDEIDRPKISPLGFELYNLNGASPASLDGLSLAGPSTARPSVARESGASLDNQTIVGSFAEQVDDYDGIDGIAGSPLRNSSIHSSMFYEDPRAWNHPIPHRVPPGVERVVDWQTTDSVTRRFVELRQLRTRENYHAFLQHISAMDNLEMEATINHMARVLFTRGVTPVLNFSVALNPYQRVAHAQRPAAQNIRTENRVDKWALCLEVMIVVLVIIIAILVYLLCTTGKG